MKEIEVKESKAHQELWGKPTYEVWCQGHFMEAFEHRSDAEKFAKKLETMRGQPPSAKANGLSLPQRGETIGLSTESPIPDIQGCSQVGVRGETASLTYERGLRNTIILGNETTTRTGLRSIAGVNQFDQHACDFSFVGDKLAELTESPRLVPAPLGFSNRSPFADTFQIFKSDTAISVFSLRHKPFANHMVGIPSKSGFPAREFLEMSFSRFSSLALESGFKVVSHLTNLVHLFARVKLTVAVNGNMDYTQVNPDSPNGVIRRWLRGINGNCKIKYAFAENKVSLFHNPIQSNFLVSSNPDRDNLATFQGKYGNLIKPLPRKNTLVINHCRVGFESNQPGFIPAVSLSDLADSPDCHLSRKPIVFAERLVSKVVEFYLSCRTVVKGKFSKIVAGFVKSLHCLKQSIILLLVGSKFDHKRLYHTFSIDKYLPPVKYSNKRRFVGFLCQINQAVSAD